jgi:hypothetical protein
MPWGKLDAWQSPNLKRNDVQTINLLFYCIHCPVNRVPTIVQPSISYDPPEQKRSKYRQLLRRPVRQPKRLAVGSSQDFDAESQLLRRTAVK